MAAQKTFTAEDLKKAQQRLSELPDLSPNKITQADFIDQLKEHIIVLSKEKGYDLNEIKAALLDVGVKVSAKDVASIIDPPRKPRSGRASSKAGTENPVPAGVSS